MVAPEPEFHRIKRLPPYVFNIVNELKAEARARGEDIIDFGMGNPDQPTPQHIVDKLVEAGSVIEAEEIASRQGVSPSLYEERDAFMRTPEIECVEEDDR